MIVMHSVFLRPTWRPMLSMLFSIQALMFSPVVLSQWLTIVDQHDDPVAHAIVTFSGIPSDIDVNALAVVDQIDQQFSPQQLIIAPGQQVSFPNGDNIRHHVYSFSTPKVFEIRLYADTPEAPILFDQAGVVVLGCNIHDNMIGHLYISSELSVVSDALGRVQIPQGATDVYVWHTRYQLDDEQRLLVRASQWQTSSTSSAESAPTIRLPLTVPAPSTVAPASGFGNHWRMGH